MPSDLETEPKGEGYIVTIKGWHLHNAKDADLYGVFYLQERLLSNLQKWRVKQQESLQEVAVRQMGITHATIIEAPTSPNDQLKYYVGGRPSDRSVKKAGGFQGARPGIRRPLQPAASSSSKPEYELLRRTRFTIEFIFQPIAFDDRVAEDPVAKAAQEKQAGENPPPANPASTTPETNPAATGTDPAAPGTPPTTGAAPATPPAAPANPTTPGT